MGIREIEHCEARDEETAITCTYLDRGTRKTFTVGRRSIVVPNHQALIDFESLDELKDLRTVINEMIESVESGQLEE